MTQNATELQIGYALDAQGFDDLCRTEPGWELTECLSEAATDAPTEELVVRC